MEIVHDHGALIRYMSNAVQVSGDIPVLLDSYLQDAIEIDTDAVCDGEQTYVAGIMQHIEEAGIHSGDSACSLPPHSLSDDIIAELKVQTRKLAEGLNVIGLMNIQYAIKGKDIYILEVNPRASRTVPFVAKATGIQVAKIAARVMAGEKLSSFNLPEAAEPKHVSVKEAVFPFARFPGVDIILGPEMKSTGEVMGIDKDFHRAFAKSQLGASMTVPQSGQVFISVKNKDKTFASDLARRLKSLGFDLVATKGTADDLTADGLDVKPINKVQDGRPHCVDAMINGEIQLVINTTAGAAAIEDSYSIRRTALTHSIPYYTTIAGAEACVGAIEALERGGLEVTPLQAYFKRP
jgi:carbamoyl-phosphate synthase large subunit